MTVPSASFKMPQEPCPLPSLECDEESFVVLGQSMPDASIDLYQEPVGLSVIAEAKRLINSELEALEQNKNDSEGTNKSTDRNNDDLQPNTWKMETSTALPAMPHIDKGGIDSSNAISITSFTTDMSSVEVQQKISQLIEENICLKDTVLQNNLSLKSQYERIVAWQEDVQKVHQAHKEKILEAKGIIENLEQEKDSLKRNLLKITELKHNQDKQIKELNMLLKEQNDTSKEIIVQKSDDNMKEFQLEIANKKIHDLEAIIDKLTNENKQLHEVKIEMNKGEEHNMKKITYLETQLEKLVLENRNLVEEEAKQQKQALRMNSTYSIEKIIAERDYALKKIECLEKELIDLTENKGDKDETAEMTISTLKAQLEMSNHEPEEIKNLRTQLAETQTTLTRMEHARAQAYVTINQLSQELSNMKNQLDVLQSKEQFRQIDRSHDEVFALETQLDVYKTDFEEERRARTIIKEEKDRLEEDLQNLQRRNQQLQEEIEIIRGERDFIVYPRTSTIPPTASSNSTFRCPRCNFSFDNLPSLEVHVQRCLDLDENLP